MSRRQHHAEHDVVHDGSDAINAKGATATTAKPGAVSIGDVPCRISRFALQQRSRLDVDEDADGVRRLMWALLKDTLRIYHARAGDPTARGQRLFREAKQWLCSEDTSWFFSFENVCAVLGLDADRIRRMVFRWHGSAVRRTPPMTAGAGRGPVTPNGTNGGAVRER